MTYNLEYTVFHVVHGDIMIPDQVVERMALWDDLNMPCIALDVAGNEIEILLTDTDA